MTKFRWNAFRRRRISLLCTRIIFLCFLHQAIRNRHSQDKNHLFSSSFFLLLQLFDTNSFLLSLLRERICWKSELCLNSTIDFIHRQIKIFFTRETNYDKLKDFLFCLLETTHFTQFTEQRIFTVDSFLILHWVRFFENFSFHKGKESFVNEQMEKENEDKEELCCWEKKAALFKHFLHSYFWREKQKLCDVFNENYFHLLNS